MKQTILAQTASMETESQQTWQMSPDPDHAPLAFFG